MKEKLMAMYEAQMIDVSGLLKAVERGWVTLEDVVEIVGEDNACLLYTSILWCSTLLMMALPTRLPP